MGQGSSSSSSSAAAAACGAAPAGRREREREREEQEAAVEAPLPPPGPPPPGGEGGRDLTQLVPDECLALVFQKLSTEERNTCALACKRWHWVDAQDRDRLTLRGHKDIAPALPSLLRRFANVSKLAVKCDRKAPGVDDTALLAIAQHCRNLRKLKLKGCKDVTDDGVEAFAAAHCSASAKLEKLSCCSCGFGARGLNAIVTHCANLEDLTVKRLRGLRDGPPEYVQPGAGRIRRLCLKDLYNAQLFAPLIAGSTRLHTLMLAKNTGNWDKLLEIITERVAGVVELHLDKLQLSDRGLACISRWKDLQVLYVGKAPECTNHGLAAVAAGCTRLRKLHVDGSKAARVGDEGLITVARKCRDLQELVLISMNATVASISSIAANCPALERLALCNSQTFGDSELSCVAAKCVALKKLCIKRCPISDTGIEALAAGCPNLVKIKVKSCRLVTPAVFSMLRTSRGSLVVTMDRGAAATPLIEEDDHQQQQQQQQVARNASARRVVANAPVHQRNRSPLARAKWAIVAGGSYVVCTVLRWSSSTASSS